MNSTSRTFSEPTPPAGQIQDFARNITLPPCPAIVAALVEEQSNDLPDLRRLESLIASDVSLSAATIKTSNSPLFRYGRPLSSLKEALQVLGVRRISAIVRELALVKALPAVQGFERFWERTRLHANACEHLCRVLSLGVTPEEAYTFGLFNDVGILVMAQRFSDYKLCLQEANDAVSFTQVEQRHYGVSHCEVGAMLAKSWHLPDAICDAIGEHHALNLLYVPNNPAPDVLTLRALSALSDAIVNRYLEQPLEAEWSVHEQAIMTRLGLEVHDFEWVYAEVAEVLHRQPTLH